MKKLIKAEKDPELVVCRWTPTESFVQIHFRPINVVVHAGIDETEVHGDWCWHKEHQHYHRADAVKTAVKEATRMSVCSLVSVLVRPNLQREVDDEVFHRQK